MPKPFRVAMMLELDQPYKRHAGIFAGAQKYAEEHDWDVTIDEYAGDTLGLRAEQYSPYDGVIARATQKLARRAARRGVQVVNVWLSSPVWRSLPGVFPDYAAAGRLRAEHLLSRGLRRFAVLTQEKNRSHEFESRAFAEVVAEAGCPCIAAKMPVLVSDTLKQWRRTERTVAAFMEQWQPPIGVYSGNEVEGRLVVQMCRNRGWRVPEDVAIIAGKNEETYCEHLRPTLSSIEFGYKRIGYEAASLLDRLMHGQSEPSHESSKAGRPRMEPMWLPLQGLIVRESTDFFAVEDTLIAAALAFIAANFHRTISPDDVAQAVHIGIRTLQMRFNKYLGKPIIAEIRRARIERAKRELAQSKRTIKEISRDCGFGPPMRMYEVFLRELGIMPSEYRRQRRSEREM